MILFHEDLIPQVIYISDQPNRTCLFLFFNLCSYMICFGFSCAIGLQVEMSAPITNLVVYVEQKPLVLKLDLQNLQGLLLDSIILHLTFRFLCLTKIFTLCIFFVVYFIQMEDLGKPSLSFGF